MTTLEIVRGRLANGLTISDSDVHKLVAEIDRLRQALREIVGTTMSQCVNAADLANRQHAIARAALGETGHE